MNTQKVIHILTRQWLKAIKIGEIEIAEALALALYFIKYPNNGE